MQAGHCRISPDDPSTDTYKWSRLAIYYVSEAGIMVVGLGWFWGFWWVWPESTPRLGVYKRSRTPHNRNSILHYFRTDSYTFIKLVSSSLDISIMLPASFDFPVLSDTRPDDHSLPAFMVSTTRGFLPRQEPIVELPKEFAVLESLLQHMPIKTLSGEPGLLANFTFGDTLLKELPDLSTEIEKYRNDLVVMNALYRDYSFLASAYLFEPCHERHMRGEEYGLGRQSLPRCIALPIVKVAEM
jgi:hypothetical protein